jgi:uncharacterized coiled-coil protein SlyX
MQPAFPDLPPDSDPNILARAHQEVTAWSRDRSREEIVAMLVETRADLLRARRDLRALARRLREIEERNAKRPAGGRGHTSEHTERMAAVRELAERMMVEWLKARWKRGLLLWSEITPEDRAALYHSIRSEIGARGLGVYPDDRTVRAWLQHVFETANRADWGIPAEPPSA